MTIAIAPVTDGRHGKQLSSVGDLKVGLFLMTLSGSYASNGDAVDFRPYFKKTGAGIIYVVQLETVGGYSMEYDYTNRKVIVRQGDKDADGPELELGAGAYAAGIKAATSKAVVWGI